MKRLLLAAALFAGSAFAQNPVVRQSRVVLFTSQAATGSATSSAVLLPNNSGYGSLQIVGTGITGSPSGCQITLAFQESLGGLTGAVFATQTFTPAVSNQQFSIVPSNVVYATGDSLVANYSCGTYPTAGTISVTWAGNTPVSVLGTVNVAGTFWQTTQPVSGAFYQATQPVSGTFWQTTQPVSAASLPLPTGAATSAAQNTGNSSLASIVAAMATNYALEAGGNLATLAAAISANRMLVSGTFWQTTQPVSGTFFQATQPVSATSLPLPTGAAQETGGNLATLAAAVSAGRYQISALPAGSNTIGAVNQAGTWAVTGLGGTFPVTGTFWQTTQPVSGSFWQTTQPVSLASIPALVAGAATIGKVDILGNAGAAVDQAPGSAAPANAVQIGATDGTNTRVPFIDPCGFSAWTYYPVNISSNTQVIAGSSGKNVYVCDVAFPPQAGAVNVNFVESSTSGNACATSTVGMMGGATAALGANITANGGFIRAFAGRAFLKTATSGDALCLFVSASANGSLAYVQF